MRNCSLVAFDPLEGAASGPSGMTTEHLRPLLDEWSSVQVLFKAGEVFGRAEIPDTVIQMVKMGRLTALSKLDGDVRGRDRICQT